jgi:hypothetical protein
VDDPEDAGKYRVENQQPVQGQVVGDNNTIEQHFYPADGSIPVAPPMSVWNIPFSHNPFFTGREEILAQIRAHFQTDHATALSQPQAMSGLGASVRPRSPLSMPIAIATTIRLSCGREPTPAKR